MQPGRFLIGEVARRTGVSPALLRAWEGRYGLITPERSPGGTRLYSEADLGRIRAMCTHMNAGLSAAQAALTARSQERAEDRQPAPALGERTADVPELMAGPSELAVGAARLADAFARLDSEAAERAFELLLANFSFETVAREVLLPYLADVGGRWERGDASIAEEHLATNLVRARLLALGGTYVTSVGGRAVLACPPQERHDLALVMLAVAMRRRGWAVTLLGADTPAVTVAEAAARVGADLIVLSGTRSEPFITVAEPLRELAARHTLFIAGSGASQAVARRCGAWWLRGDPVAAVVELAPFRFSAS